jgi:TonB family protein
MYRSSKYETEKQINLSIPWDSITVRSWLLSFVITGFILVLLSFYKLRKPAVQKIPERQSIVLLNFGDGDGTGKSKGNIREEGKSTKGNKTPTNLDDAQKSSTTKRDNNPSTATIEESNKVVAVKDLPTKKVDKPKPDGKDTRNIGKKGADDLFAGLGDKGRGIGAGTGLGDIEWGGGGNRTIRYKKAPEYPDNVRATSRLVLEITVLPDGTVSRVVSKKKGDPRLENAAIKALKKWRFNPIDSNTVMIGEVPITFAVR